MSNSYDMIIPANVWNCEELSDSEKILYCLITTLQNKNGVCFASNGYLAKVTRVHKNTVGNRINKLKKLGFIDTKILYKIGSKEVRGRKITLCSTSVNDTIERIS